MEDNQEVIQGYLQWLKDHPDADPESIKEVQRRLRELRLNNHLNSVKQENKDS